MEKKKMLFIYNPKAGKAQIRSNLLELIDIFVKAGYEVTAYPTQGRGDGVRAVKEMRPDYYDMIACSGGDGTLDEVVTGMMQRDKRLPIGYVPAGSTNDFANSLHIPKKMAQAAEVVVNGRDFAVDIGSFNNDTFVYTAAFGLFTDVSYETRQDLKNVLGHTAYLLEGAKRLSSIRSYPMTIEYGEECLRGDFLLGMITNSLSVGGFKGITGADVCLDDGEFECMFIKNPTNPAELNEIIAALLNRTMDTDMMHCFKASRLKIKSEEPVAYTLDGEFGGEHTEVLVSNQRRALVLRVPE